MTILNFRSVIENLIYSAIGGKFSDCKRSLHLFAEGENLIQSKKIFSVSKFFTLVIENRIFRSLIEKIQSPVEDFKNAKNLSGVHESAHRYNFVLPFWKHTQSQSVETVYTIKTRTRRVLKPSGWYGVTGRYSFSADHMIARNFITHARMCKNLGSGKSLRIF